MIHKDKELQFYIDHKSKTTINLDDYGEVLESCYGEFATKFYQNQIEKLGSDKDLKRALDLEKNKEFDEAHLIYDVILKDHPEYDYCISCKAWSYAQEDKFDESIALYDRAIKIRPGSM